MALDLTLSGPLDFSCGEVQNSIKEFLVGKSHAKSINDTDFLLFLSIANSLQLNPFLNEIDLLVMKDKVQPFCTFKGYLKVAYSHPQFDGLKRWLNYNDKGEIISATAEVYRKDKNHPYQMTVLMREFNKGNHIWKTMPGHMLLKCAGSIVLRESFPSTFNGTYTQEELSDMIQPVASDKTQTSTSPEVHMDEYRETSVDSPVLPSQSHNNDYPYGYCVKGVTGAERDKIKSMFSTIDTLVKDGIVWTRKPVVSLHKYAYEATT